MTQPEPPALDVLPASPPARARRGRGLLLGAVGGAAALALAGTTWAAASFLSGGGAQPEDVLPADAVALVKVDLDPPGGQKLAVYRLAQRFPAAKDELSGEDDVRSALLRRLLDGSGELDDDLDYERDVGPWIGDRVGVAAVPVAGGTPQPLAAVAFTDRDEAEQALRRVASRDDGVHYAFSDRADFVLIGSSQEVVDAAAAADDVLADAEPYRDLVDDLDADQVVTGWADVGALWQSLPQEARAAGEDLRPTGRIAVGVHAEDDAVELVGRVQDLRTGRAQADAVAGGSAELVRRLPADVVGAVGVTGLGDALASALEELPEAEALRTQLGPGAADDLRALLGDEVAVGVLGSSSLAVRSASDDPERGRAALDRLPGGLGGLLGTLLSAGAVTEVPGEPAPSLRDEQVRVLGDGLVVGTDAEAVDAVARGGRLGDSELFRDAVPDAGDAGLVVFVDVQRAVRTAGEPDPDLAPLAAVGFTARGGPDGSFRLRLTVR